MASYSANEWANRVAVPNVMNKAYTDGGRVRIATFSWTTPAGLLANDTLNLCQLPAGAILLSGYVQYGVMGAGATLSIGITGTATKYANAINVAAAGQSSFLNTATLNSQLELTAAENVIATLSGAAWAAAQSLKGYIMYARD